MKRTVVAVLMMLTIVSWAGLGLSGEKSITQKGKEAVSEAKKELTGEKGPAEKVGESLDKAGERVKEAASEAKEELMGDKGKGEEIGEKIDKKMKDE